MPTILDISGKPPPRSRSKQRLQAQDIRDLSKIAILLLLIVTGYFLFAPARNATDEIRAAAAQGAQR
jgi:hypothetical protein